MVDSEFVWRKVSEKDKEKIKKDAKKIMGSFSAKISGLKNFKEFLTEREGGEREEKEGKSCDSSFRKSMFENAPNKKGDFIVAEKKSW